MRTQVSENAASPAMTSILVKPAGPDCNLACAYCFYLKKAALFASERHRMSPATLEQTIRQGLEKGGQQVSFGWQGGEPTLMGLDFFRRAVELQRQHRRPRQQVLNGLQTNGWVIDDAWCGFLRENNFLVGLSLDGPAHVHDRYRKTSDGRPSFERVRDAAVRMLQSRVAVNALVVVSDYSARLARQIYDFQYGLGFRHMQFIPCVELDPKDGSRPAPYSVSGRAFGRFLCELFDRWREDFRQGWPTVYVRYFESLLHTYCGVPAPDCTLAATCGGYVVVEHNGDVFSCDFFVEPEWRLGNVMSGTLAQMLQGDRQRRFGQQKADLSGACRGCRWLRQCYGGCLKERFVGDKARKRTRLCEGYQMFFEHADKRLRSLAARWLRERSRASASSFRPEE